MPANGRRAIASFTLTTQAQVDYVISQNWSGTMSVGQLREYIARRGSALGITRDIYCWKIADILRNCPAAIPRSKSPDTWLRKPYQPGVTPLSLP